MAFILSIETSTTVCSVALSKDGHTISSLEEHQANSHAAILTVLINQILSNEDIKTEQLSAVAVSSGPGSYTGLRIGVSVAKGICYASKIPLIALPTLQIMAANAVSKIDAKENILLCPMIDARRMEVYSALYQCDLQLVQDVAAEIITEDSYKNLLTDQKILFVGNGAGKCRPLIQHHNALFMDDVYAPAAEMAILAFEKYTKQQFEDVAYFEPFYLKNFIATKPKKKLL
jgi:tRNA threonylcarbamoyladenosine biosynthesis protein TsaB